LVTGTPGVGKTAVSRSLASKLGAIHIDVAGLVKEENLAVGRDDARQTLVADTKTVQKRVEEIIQRVDKDVVVDGHYAVDVVPPRTVNRVFVLRRSPDELKATLEAYGFAGKKLWENLAAEILDVCLWDAISACGAGDVCELDVSGKAVKEVVEAIGSVLEGEEMCERGVADWLGQLESEGRLSDFLRDF
jgi:adenylate kinase